MVLSADHTPLAYTLREGPGPALIYTNGFTTSDFYWRYILPYFDGRVTQVVWDLKGHGASAPARTPEGATMEACADDIRRIMDDAGIERATLVGFSLGCQMILEAWRQFPERINAIAALFGTYGRPFDSLLHPRLSGPLFGAFSKTPPRAIGGALGLASRAARLPGSHAFARLARLVGPVRGADMAAFYAHLGEVDPQTWQWMGISAQHHTTEDLLESISVPVLVMTGGGDHWTPPMLGERMARQIADCTWHHYPKATHTALFEIPGTVNAALNAFLKENALLA